MSKKNNKNRQKDILEQQKEELKMKMTDSMVEDTIMRTFRFKPESPHAEMSERAVARLDEIYNAVYAMLNEICEDEDCIEWDMSIIGPVADCAIGVMKNAGYKVSYQGMVDRDDGTLEYAE